MKTRVFVVHGWGGSPQGDWMPWVKKVLEERGFEVHVPEMPDTEHPKIKPWVHKFEETVGEIKPDDIFIGHSIGCQTILRYLQNLSEKIKVRRVILVAGWDKYLTLDENEEEGVAKPWRETPIDYQKVRKMAEEFIAIFSKDDPWVPYKESSEIYKEKLGARIITKDGFGHFTAGEGSTKLPLLLEFLE